MTEDEQLDMIRAWWKQYGHWVIYAVLAVCVLYTTHYFWNQSQKQRQEQASSHFLSLTQAVQQKNTAEIESQLKLLKDKYAKTTYAEEASLLAARVSVDAQEYDEAKRHLTWVVKEGKHEPYRNLAQIRLARILIDQKETTEAQKILADLKESDSYDQSIVLELEGDALKQEGNTQEANAAYQQALEQLPEMLQNHPWLSMKANDL